MASSVDTYCKNCSCTEVLADASINNSKFYGLVYEKNGFSYEDGYSMDDLAANIGEVVSSWNNQWGYGSDCKVSQCKKCACVYQDDTHYKWYVQDPECEQSRGTETLYQDISYWDPPSLFKSAASTEEFGDDYAINDIAITSTDDWEFMEEWGFSVESITDTTFDNLEYGEVGMWFEYIPLETDDGATADYNKIYHATFEQTEPTFSGMTEASTGIWKVDVELDSTEQDALEELYGFEDDLETTLNSVAKGIAEVVALSTAGAAHTFKKIRSAKFDENTFDVFEEEEEAQTTAVSTTYSSTVTYQGGDLKWRKKKKIFG